MAYHNIAGTYRDTGRIQLALKNFQKAIELNPNFIFTYRSLADLYWRLGQYDKCRENLLQILRIDPMDEMPVRLCKSRTRNTAHGKFRSLRSFLREKSSPGVWHRSSIPRHAQYGSYTNTPGIKTTPGASICTLLIPAFLALFSSKANRQKSFQNLFSKPLAFPGILYPPGFHPPGLWGIPGYWTVEHKRLPK